MAPQCVQFIMRITSIGPSLSDVAGLTLESRARHDVRPTASSEAVAATWPKHHSSVDLRVTADRVRVRESGKGSMMLQRDYTMVAPHERELLAAATRSLPKLLRNCCAVAEALLLTNQRLVRLLGLNLLQQPTEYELARKRSIGTIQEICRRMKQIREDHLRANVIRAVAHLQRVEHACKLCPGANKRGFAQGKPFVCRAAELVGQRGNRGYRFRLDHAGRIIQSTQ